MGREKSTKLFTFESKKCGCALFAAEKEGCCDDKSELIKLQTEQQVAQSFSLAIPELAIIAPLHFELIELHQYEVGNFYETDFSPPPREPHYKRFCSFRFYDDEDVRA